MSHRTQTLEIAVTYFDEILLESAAVATWSQRQTGWDFPAKQRGAGVRSDNGPWSMLESCGRAATQMEDTPGTLRIKQPFGDLPDISSIGIANIRTHRWHIQPDTEEYSEPC
jgi:hypothetical protein